jgi:CRISPR/Cas system CMR-associated protein Cmr1 (group 7 of RAMP superfamily)
VRELKLETLHHQISLDCIEKLVECIERFNKGKIDADTSSKIERQILEDEFDDPEFLEFAIEHYSKMFGYINIGRVNIKIHRDIEGKMWFGVG